VNLIYNSEKSIFINAKELETGTFKTFELNIETLKNISEKKEELQTFFKSVFNKNIKKWYLLDFTI
jgi:hypothetical protein